MKINGLYLVAETSLPPNALEKLAFKVAEETDNEVSYNIANNCIVILLKENIAHNDVHFLKKIRKCIIVNEVNFLYHVLKARKVDILKNYNITAMTLDTYLKKGW